MFLASVHCQPLGLYPLNPERKMLTPPSPPRDYASSGFWRPWIRRNLSVPTPPLSCDARNRLNLVVLSESRARGFDQHGPRPASSGLLKSCEDTAHTHTVGCVCRYPIICGTKRTQSLHTMGGACVWCSSGASQGAKPGGVLQIFELFKCGRNVFKHGLPQM